MVANNPKQGSSKDTVTASNWTACFNSGDDTVVLSCTVTTNDSSPTITGVGLILNTSDGKTLATSYTELSGGSETASPSINLAPAGLGLGDGVLAIVTGEAGGEHFFFEQELKIGNC